MHYGICKCMCSMMLYVSHCISMFPFYILHWPKLRAGEHSAHLLAAQTHQGKQWPPGSQHLYRSCQWHERMKHYMGFISDVPQLQQWVVSLFKHVHNRRWWGGVAAYVDMDHPTLKSVPDATWLPTSRHHSRKNPAKNPASGPSFQTSPFGSYPSGHFAVDLSPGNQVATAEPVLKDTGSLQQPSQYSQ